MSYNGRKKLPGRDTQRTINRLYLHIPIYLNYNGSRGLEISEGKTPYGISTNKRITRRLLKENKPVVCKPNPIEIALKYKKIYDDPDYGTLEKVAQEFGISRVRVHQMLNLLKLDQRIIDYIQNIKDPQQRNFWTEHRLRELTLLPKQKQFDIFKSPES